MRWQRSVLVLMLAVSMAGPAWAGPLSFLRKKQQPQGQQPAPVQQRTSELILTLKTDQDAAKRVAAAEELRDQDVRSNPEVIPVLIEAAQRDAKPEVRLAAVQSLGRFRPVSAEVGRVIEQVAGSDSSMRVRVSARSTLWQYQMAGYRGGNNAAGAAPAGPSTTQEPPLAGQSEGPALNAPADAAPTPSPSFQYPQPMPAGPAVYPAPTPSPQQPRLAPVPAGRTGPTSWQNQPQPVEWPALQTGTPLSNYRLIQAPPRSSDGVETEMEVAPLRHEEVQMQAPASPPPLRKFMVTLPAPGASQPTASPIPTPMPETSSPVIEPMPDDSGPVLSAPQ